IGSNHFQPSPIYNANHSILIGSNHFQLSPINKIKVSNNLKISFESYIWPIFPPKYIQH
ncbi:hypothetical protein LINGRAHAP2_LOCUS25067, partial [Linum grandiflorum]